MPQRGATFGQDYPALEQHCAQLIGEPGPRRDESLACPVQHLQIELLLALERHETHCRPCRGLGDRLRVAVVRLLRLYVGLHILGRHQPDGVPLRGKRPAQEVRATTRFHRDHARRQPGHKLDQSLACQPTPHNDCAGCIQPRKTAAVLPEIDAEHRNRRLAHRPLLCSRSKTAPGREGRAIP